MVDVGRFRDVTGMYKWVGVRANYSDAFIWLNGEVLQRDDPYWNPIGCLLRFCYTIHKLLLACT